LALRDGARRPGLGAAACGRQRQGLDRHQHQRLVRHLSTSQDFNGDIALIACFASSWTAAMVRRWHADPFGFLRPWNEVPALMGECATRHARIDRHGRGHLPDGVASWTARISNCRGPAGVIDWMKTVDGIAASRHLRDRSRLVEPRPAAPPVLT
jgi:hypothetical protein